MAKDYPKPEAPHAGRNSRQLGVGDVGNFFTFSQERPCQQLGVEAVAAS